ncbi:MAG: hypothetical protein J2P25_23695 [Nocardiopsaceae bacterium]|nr:hypothetical protein [Nocardiopsaceae bacterium]
MMNSLLDTQVVRDGAMPPVGSGCPWAITMPGAWDNRVPAPIPGSAAATSRTAKVAVPRGAAAIRRPSIVMPLDVMTGLPPVDNRKQYVHKTRVNAGGDGAMGPHPEREPA